jgi:secretion/DNA translocation related TadE-like protein
MRSDPPSQRSEQGLATVWGLAWLAVCLTVGWLSVVAAGIASTQHHLDAAADLAALSAAARLQRGGDACAVADQIAGDNAAEVSGCTIDGGDVVVTVHGVVPLPFGLDGAMTAEARAGP